LRDLLGRDAPDLGDVAPGFRIANQALSWKLVAFLPVLASSLAVALARDHHAAGPFATEVSRGQAQVDKGEHVLHAF
jgi:hypothetical protein